MLHNVARTAHIARMLKDANKNLFNTNELHTLATHIDRHKHIKNHPRFSFCIRPDSHNHWTKFNSTRIYVKCLLRLIRSTLDIVKSPPLKLFLNKSRLLWTFARCRHKRPNKRTNERAREWATERKKQSITFCISNHCFVSFRWMKNTNWIQNFYYFKRPHFKPFISQEIEMKNVRIL